MFVLGIVCLQEIDLNHYFFNRVAQLSDLSELEIPQRKWDND